MITSMKYETDLRMNIEDARYFLDTYASQRSSKEKLSQLLLAIVQLFYNDN